MTNRNRTITGKPLRSAESGAALIAVLCLILMAGLLAGAMLTMSKYNTFTARAHLELQKSMYINEGAATRIQYLIAADRSLYSTVQLGETSYGDYDTYRFFADGVVHVMDYHGTPVEFTITDARSGFNLSAGRYSGTLTRISDVYSLNPSNFEFLHIPDLPDLITRINAGITDYIDSDDTVTVEGGEHADYESLDMSPLPRNDALQFRAELAWVPGVTTLFPPDPDGRLSSIQLIPPEGFGIPRGTPSLFTADRLELKVYCSSLEDAEIDKVLEALKVFHRQRVLLSDQLDSLLIPKLYNLSWEESGIYTVRVGPRATPVSAEINTADAGEGAVDARGLPKRHRISSRLTFSFSGFDIGGPSNSTVQYFEWMFH